MVHVSEVATFALWPMALLHPWAVSSWCQLGCVPFRNLWGTVHSFAFSRFRRSQHPLAGAPSSVLKACSRGPGLRPRLSDSPFCLLSLQFLGLMWSDWPHLEDPGQAKLIRKLNSLLPGKVMYSRARGIRTWASLRAGGPSSVY